MIAPNFPTSLEAIQATLAHLLTRAKVRKTPREPVPAHTLRGGHANGASIRRAVWTDDLLSAYGFLHEALAQQGFIAPSSAGLLRTTPFDAVPEMAVFMAHDETSGIVAVQSAITDSPDVGLPSDQAFAVEIDSLRRGGRILCEAARPEVVVPLQNSALAGELLRCCTAYAVSMGCNDLVIAVQPWEAPAYAEMGFYRAGPVRTFSSEIPFPAILMELRLEEPQAPPARSDQRGPPARECPNRFIHRNPYDRLMTQWSVLADRAFADPQFLQELFIEKTGLLGRCSDEQRATICGRWRRDLFDHIWPAEPKHFDGMAAESIADASEDVQWARPAEKAASLPAESCPAPAHAESRTSGEDRLILRTFPKPPDLPKSQSNLKSHLGAETRKQGGKKMVSQSALEQTRRWSETQRKAAIDWAIDATTPFCPTLDPPAPATRAGAWRTWPSAGAGAEERLASVQPSMKPDQADRLKRRIARLRKSGMFDPQGPSTCIDRAVTIGDLAEAYALVHDVYVEQKYMRPAVGEVRIRPFEASPDMATFVARVDGKIVAVTSLVADSPDLGLPSDHVYGEEIDKLRALGPTFEITNLAIHPDYRNRPLFLQLTQAIFAHARAAGCANLFISVSPGHTHFFHDVCQFEPWGERRSYSQEVVDIVEGMKIGITDYEITSMGIDRSLGAEDAFLYKLYFSENPFHARVGEWAHAAARTFDNPRMLRDLFLLRSRFLLDCSDEELDAVYRRWGDWVYWRVWGEDDDPLARRSTSLQALNMTRSPFRESFSPARIPVY